LRPECHPARPALSGILDSETAATFLARLRWRNRQQKAADEIIIRRWEIRAIAD